MLQPNLLPKAADKPTARYVYRARYYEQPPTDWPRPKTACYLCHTKGWDRIEGWDATHAWKWTGYEWTCTKGHEL